MTVKDEHIQFFALIFFLLNAVPWNAIVDDIYDIMYTHFKSGRRRCRPIEISIFYSALLQ